MVVCFVTKKKTVWIDMERCVCWSQRGGAIKVGRDVARAKIRMHRSLSRDGAVLLH
jgi:hypothetical protein